jgi:hypothetical protein
MFIAIKTVTRYVGDTRTVTLVAGKQYSAEQLANMPSWYRDYVVPVK